jgi:MoaA/NifB/PqqE/SkfB family radical SAM enzyme
LDDLYGLGVKKIVVSPFIPKPDSADHKKLVLPEKETALAIKKLLEETIEWKKYSGVEMYIKTDFVTSLPFQEELSKIGLIDTDDLRVDAYGLIFNQRKYGKNMVIVNYTPFDYRFIQAVRISHDGYVGDCYDMFFSDEEYHRRAIGNVWEKPINQILREYAKKELTKTQKK